jgi:hypothetical protein
MYNRSQKTRFKSIKHNRCYTKTVISCSTGILYLHYKLHTSHNIKSEALVSPLPGRGFREGDIGWDYGSEHFAAIGVIYSTSSSEGGATNIFIAPGVYDIYMSVSRGVFCVMNQGDLPDLDVITK